MTPTIISALKCIVAGIAIALITEQTIGVTAAIAAPKELFDWFFVRNLKVTIIVLWDIFIVYIPGLAIVAVLITFFVIKHSSLTWIKTCMYIILTNYLYVFIASPLINNHDFYYFKMVYWQHSYEFVLIASVLMSGYVASRLNHGVK